VPGLPHHVTQRGNRRQPVFFSADDYVTYRAILAEGCAAAGVEVWAYCLMPNHVHLILVPSEADGLRAALAEAHRRYTRHINFREGWRGYLWQGRFASFPMDEPHLLAAARYVELNPVRAALARRARDWHWSSARAHLAGKDDALVTVRPLLALAPDWAAFLGGGLSAEDHAAIRAGERTGRPLGTSHFISRLEKRLSRPLARRKPGPKPGNKYCVPGTAVRSGGNLGIKVIHRLIRDWSPIRLIECCIDGGSGCRGGWSTHRILQRNNGRHWDARLKQDPLDYRWIRRDIQAISDVGGNRISERGHVVGHFAYLLVASVNQVGVKAT